MKNEGLPIFALPMSKNCGKIESESDRGGDDMRCSCQNCGVYMVQDEKGIGSRCICPECFTTCNACMGTRQAPMDPDSLKFMMLARERYDAEHEDDD